MTCLSEHDLEMKQLKDELHRIKQSHARLSRQVKDARKVIMLYRRWEHASDVEIDTGDECDTEDMLFEASCAAQEFVDTWENQIRSKKGDHEPN